MQRKHRILLYILLGFLGVVIVVAVFINRIILSEMEKAFSESAFSNTSTVHIGGVSYNPFRNILSVSDIDILPNDSLSATRLHIEEITFRNGLLRMLLGKKITPELEITISQPSLRWSLDKPSAVSFLPIENNGFHLLLRKIMIDDASVIIQDSTGGHTKGFLHFSLQGDSLFATDSGTSFQLKHLVVSAPNPVVQIDSETYPVEIEQAFLQISDSRFVVSPTETYYHFGKMTAQIRHLKTDTGSNYSIALDSAYLSDNHLFLKGFEVLPSKSDKAFSKSLQYADEQYTISLDSVVTNTFRIDSLLTRQCVEIDTLCIYQLSARIYRDNSKRLNPKIIRLFLAQKLQQIPIPFVIRHYLSKNTNIVYCEKKHSKKGRVRLRLKNTVAKNLTNTDAAGEFSAFITGSIEQKIPFDAHFTSSYSKPYATYDITTGHFYTQIIGRSMELFSPVSFADSGEIDSIHFTGFANEKYTKGTLLFLYHNLHLKTKSQPFLIKQVLSFLSKKTMLSSNPKEKGSPIRITNVLQIRDKHRSIVNLLVKAMTKGMFETTKTKSVKFIEKQMDIFHQKRAVFTEQ